MARRVGFGDTQRDRVAARADTPAKTHSVPPPDDDASGNAALARKLRFGPRRFEALYAGQKRPVIWFIIGFLCFWLIGWTLGIVFTIATLVSGGDGLDGGHLFLVVWLGSALVGWGFAVWVLYWLIRGVRAVRNQPARRRSGSD